MAFILDAWREADLPEPFKATLGLLEILTLRPMELVPEDVQAVLDAGATRAQVQEAMDVCVEFTMTNRLADAFDWETPTGRDLRRTGWMLDRFADRMVR